MSTLAPVPSRSTALPRLPAAARRALHADGLTTLEDVVDAGRHHVASLPGVDGRAMAVLDAAVHAAGRADPSPRAPHVLLAATA